MRIVPSEGKLAVGVANLKHFKVSRYRVVRQALMQTASRAGLINYGCHVALMPSDGVNMGLPPPVHLFKVGITDNKVVCTAFSYRVLPILL